MTRAGIGRVTRVVAAALMAAGCSTPNHKSGLTVPSAVGSGVGSLSGTLVSYGTGAPVAAATVRLGSVIGISNSAGAFTLAGTPDSGSAVVTAVLPGFLFRGVAFSLAPIRTGVSLDLIQDATPFSLTFYRELARNGAESATLEATRRWTISPSFYFQLLTLDTGDRVPDDVINSIKANFMKSVAELSNGRFTVAAFDQGDTARDPQDGWVNVTFYKVPPGGAYSFSTVGGNSGSITLRYDPNMASSSTINPLGCTSVALWLADHEIIHTMGFWHTDNVLVDEFSGAGCTGAGRPDYTRYHANIVYSRPVGNIDPDVDPVSSFHEVAPGVGRPVVVCDAASFRRGR
jgi:hypothetical protein